MVVFEIKNDANLNKVLKGPSFIFFHWEKCSHCIDVNPKFKEASTQVGGVKFASLEVSQMQKTKYKSKYNSFPKFEAYNSNGREIIYTGGREVKDFVKFTKELSTNIIGGKKSPKRKSLKRKSPKRKSLKRKSPKRKSLKRKSLKRKSLKRKSLKRKLKKSRK